MTIIIATLIIPFIIIILRFIYPAILRFVHKIGAPGIDVMETVEIGGIRQALFFRGQNTENPAILLIHGGPGGSQMQFIHNYQYEWEHDFTVVNWDQRNSGKTHYANDPEAVRGTINAQRALKDAHEVTQYIKQKLGKDKIIIMGHSWGSVLGTMLVQAYPEDYSAFISVGQITNMTDNERVGYEKVLELARIAGNRKDIAVLEAITPYSKQKGYNDASIKQMRVLRKIQGKYNLAMIVDIKTTIAANTSPYCTSREIAHYVAVEQKYYQGALMHFLMEEFDIYNYGTNYAIPVYYIMGENDWQTPYPLSKEFFEKITAPDKAFFSVPDAGHFPMMDNKAEFTRVLLEGIGPLIRN